MTIPNYFYVRAEGGVTFLTNTSGLPLTGVVLAHGSSSWAPASDRNIKANFAPVDGRGVLARLLAMPIETWNYLSQDPAIRHIGPMAQDFAAAFEVGEDDTHISTVDADGVALAAIQGLHALLQEEDDQIAAEHERVGILEQQNAVQPAQLAAQQAEITALKAQVAALESVQAAQQAALAGRLATLEQALGN